MLVLQLGSHLLHGASNGVDSPLRVNHDIVPLALHVADLRNWKSYHISPLDNGQGIVVPHLQFPNRLPQLLGKCELGHRL